jgi:hypothetical protein
MQLKLLTEQFRQIVDSNTTHSGRTYRSAGRTTLAAFTAHVAYGRGHLVVVKSKNRHAHAIALR